MIYEKDSPDQKHSLENLVLVLKYGGFFRHTNGLNSLQTFKQFAQIMNKPNGFTVDHVAEPISTIINNFSPLFNTTLSSMSFFDNHPFPIIYLLGIEHPNQCVHAVVLKGWQTGSWWEKYLPKWAKFSSKTMLRVRNSSKGQIVFGQVQQGEREIEYKVTPDNNKWNLYADGCVYITIS